MALSAAKNVRWSRMHFLVRLAGVTGLLTVGVGLVLLSVRLRWEGIGLIVLGGLLAAGAVGVETTAAVGQMARRRGAAA